MTKISAASPNEQEQEQKISIRQFMKTQKQFAELMFQKYATATSTPQSSGPYMWRTHEINSNDASQQESDDRAIQENIPGVSRKGKRVDQVNQNSLNITPLRLR